MEYLTTEQIKGTIARIYDDIPFSRKYKDHVNLIEQWSRILLNMERAEAIAAERCG